MPANCQLSAAAVQQFKRHPIHPVLRQLGEDAAERNVVDREEFKKLIAYILEVADGRDRREPWTQKPGVARPVPKLRVIIESCFGNYADLTWFKLNKTTNNSGMPLTGMFPRMSASVARVDPEEIAEIVRALISVNPDAALHRILQRTGGKIRHMGMELFSRLCFAFRPDKYFVLPKAWADTSGTSKFIGGDLRRYCAVSRAFRTVCDDLDIEESIRGPVVLRALDSETPHAVLVTSLNQTLGPSLARFAVLEPADAYESSGDSDALSATPLDFAARSIRARRGDRRLRARLVRAYGDSCAITGKCPIDLLEVAYVVPFPASTMQSVDNALLLRSDIHTLWDLNLIAVEPESMKIRISPRLHASVYENVDGKVLLESGERMLLDKQALVDRWNAFTATRKKKNADQKRTEPGASPSIKTFPRKAEDPKSSTGSFMGLRIKD